MHKSSPIIDVAVVMQSVINKSRAYFDSEFGIALTETSSNAGALNLLKLLDMTAIIGLGGGVNLLVAFSFDYSQINFLYQRMTAEFEVKAEEVDTFREATAGEVVNTILGHCTVDFPQVNGHAITLTPPIIIEQVKCIHRMKNAMFHSQSLKSDYGCMDINLVGPCDIFTPNLDYLK